MRKWIVFFAFLLGLDMATKLLAIHFIPALSMGSYPFGGIPVFSLGGITFSLNYIVNTGAAWGMFAGYPGVLFAIRTVIIASLALFAPKKWPMWLVLTGALGNAIDYCCYGHVIDFLHFTFWGYSFPIFNVADSCITIGVCSLVLLSKKEAQVKTS